MTEVDWQRAYKKTYQQSIPLVKPPNPFSLEGEGQFEGRKPLDFNIFSPNPIDISSCIAILPTSM